MNCTFCKHWGKCPQYNGSNGEIDTVHGKQTLLARKTGIFCTDYAFMYLTMTQYKERTGEEYPDDGPIWCLDEYDVGDMPKSFWDIGVYEDCKNYSYEIVLCAIGSPNPPHDDWRPE